MWSTHSNIGQDSVSVPPWVPRSAPPSVATPSGSDCGVPGFDLAHSRQLFQDKVTALQKAIGDRLGVASLSRNGASASTAPTWHTSNAGAGRSAAPQQSQVSQRDCGPTASCSPVSCAGEARSPSSGRLGTYFSNYERQQQQQLQQQQQQQVADEHPAVARHAMSPNAHGHAPPPWHSASSLGGVPGLSNTSATAIAAAAKPALVAERRSPPPWLSAAFPTGVSPSGSQRAPTVEPESAPFPFVSSGPSGAHRSSATMAASPPPQGAGVWRDAPLPLPRGASLRGASEQSQTRCDSCGSERGGSFSPPAMASTQQQQQQHLQYQQNQQQQQQQQQQFNPARLASWRASAPESNAEPVAARRPQAQNDQFGGDDDACDGDRRDEGHVRHPRWAPPQQDHEHNHQQHLQLQHHSHSVAARPPQAHPTREEMSARHAERLRRAAEHHAWERRLSIAVAGGAPSSWATSLRGARGSDDVAAIRAALLGKGPPPPLSSNGAGTTANDATATPRSASAQLLPPTPRGGAGPKNTIAAPAASFQPKKRSASATGAGSTPFASVAVSSHYINIIAGAAARRRSLLAPGASATAPTTAAVAPPTTAPTSLPPTTAAPPPSSTVEGRPSQKKSRAGDQNNTGVGMLPPPPWEHPSEQRQRSTRKGAPNKPGGKVFTLHAPPRRGTTTTASAGPGAASSKPPAPSTAGPRRQDALKGRAPAKSVDRAVGADDDEGLFGVAMAAAAAAIAPHLAPKAASPASPSVATAQALRGGHHPLDVHSQLQQFHQQQEAARAAQAFSRLCGPRSATTTAAGGLVSPSRGGVSSALNAVGSPGGGNGAAISVALFGDANVEAEQRRRMLEAAVAAAGGTARWDSAAGVTAEVGSPPLGPPVRLTFTPSMARPPRQVGGGALEERPANVAGTTPMWPSNKPSSTALPVQPREGPPSYVLGSTTPFQPPSRWPQSDANGSRTAQGVDAAAAANALSRSIMAHVMGGTAPATAASQNENDTYETPFAIQHRLPRPALKPQEPSQHRDPSCGATSEYESAFPVARSGVGAKESAAGGVSVAGLFAPSHAAASRFSSVYESPFSVESEADAILRRIEDMRKELVPNL